MYLSIACTRRSVVSVLLLASLLVTCSSQWAVEAEDEACMLQVPAARRGRVAQGDLPSNEDILKVLSGHSPNNDEEEHLEDPGKDAVHDDPNGKPSNAPPEDDDHDHDAPGAHDAPAVDSAGDGSRVGHDPDAHDTHAVRAAHDAHHSHAVHSIDRAGHEAHAAHSQGHGGHVSYASPMVGLTLLGTIAVVMCAFYLVNYPDVRIQQTTWLLLSSTLSILGAVLIFDTIRKLSAHILHGQTASHHGPPSHSELLWNSIRLLAIACVLFLLLDLTHSTTWLFDAIRTMGAPVVGFAAIDVFGNGQQLFASSPWLALLEAFLSGVAILIILGVLDYLLNIVLKGELTHKFQHQTHVTENKAAGLMLGLLLAQVIKFVITGQLQPVHGNTKKHPPAEVWTLFGCSVVLLVSVALTDVTRREVAARCRSNWKVRSVEIVETLFAMGAAWCLLSWGDWLFCLGVGLGVEENAERMLSFLFFLLTGFIVVFLLDVLEDRGVLGRVTIESLVGAVGLLFGVSWKQCMSTAVAGIEALVSPDKKVFVSCAINVALLILVVPASAMYILPKMEQVEEEREHHLKQEIHRLRSTIMQEESSASESDSSFRRGASGSRDSQCLPAAASGQPLAAALT